jgi:acetyl-CoA acetyltransferase
MPEAVIVGAVRTPIGKRGPRARHYTRAGVAHTYRSSHPGCA